ncbi:MAG: hypothetical protein ACTSQ8_26060 [Candidatus Helarchaeota archaeon]
MMKIGVGAGINLAPLEIYGHLRKVEIDIEGIGTMTMGELAEKFGYRTVYYDEIIKEASP